MKSVARGKKCYILNETVFSQRMSRLYFNNHTAGSTLQQRNVYQGAQTCGPPVHFVQPSHHITAVTEHGLARCLSPTVSQLASADIIMWHRDRRMSSEQWQNGADRGKQNYSQKNLSQCRSVHQNSPIEPALDQIVQCQKNF